MTVDFKYQRFEDSNFPSRLQVDTSQTKKGKGEVTISGTSGNIIKIAATNIKPLPEKKGWGIGMPSFSKKTVELTAEQPDHSYVKISVKIKDLSKAIGLSKDEIVTAEKEGRLEALIEDTLSISREAERVEDAQKKMKHVMFQLEERLKGREDLQPPLKPSPATTSTDSTAQASAEVKEERVIPQEIRERTLQNLKEFGLTNEEFEQIATYYETHLSELNELEEPTHIRKETIDPKFPRSLVYVPEGPRKGLYVLLKSKGGVKEVGLGATNRATKALHIDTGATKIFRDGKAEAVWDNEFLANKKAQARPDLLAAGTPVKYKGPWRTRERQKNMPKDHLTRETNVDKVGFIMDWLEGGELFEIMQKKPLTYKEAVYTALHVARGLQVMQEELDLVHLDLKPENVFMTKAGFPKVSDFGYATPLKGESPFCGTPGYIAPEMVRTAMLKQKYYVSGKEDVWALGSLMAELIHGGVWYNWNGQGNQDWKKALDSTSVENIKGVFFPERRNPFHLDNVIDACLKVNPTERMGIATVVTSLEALYQGL